MPIDSTHEHTIYFGERSITYSARLRNVCARDSGDCVAINKCASRLASRVVRPSVRRRRMLEMRNAALTLFFARATRTPSCLAENSNMDTNSLTSTRAIYACSHPAIINCIILHVIIMCLCCSRRPSCVLCRFC